MASKSITSADASTTVTFGEDFYPQTLSIKGYPGLTFYINKFEHPVTIYNSNGNWSQELDGKIKLFRVTFDPKTMYNTNKKIVINAI